MDKKNETVLLSLAPRLSALEIITAVVAIITAAISFWFTTVGKDQSVSLKKDDIEIIRTAIEENTSKIEKLNMLISKSEKAVESLISDSEDIEISILSKKIQEQQQDITGLKLALGDDVEKALSVALLRKDLETAVSQYKELSGSTVRSVDRVYDQNKWFLGLMATMTLSVIGLALSVFASKTKDRQES